MHLEWAKHDLSQITDRTIPGWVNAVVYGTVVIFFSFAFVQLIFQRLCPGHYWGACRLLGAVSLQFVAPLAPPFPAGTELIYCFLSLTAKMYLGWFLLINVLFVDGSVETALAGMGA